MARIRSVSPDLRTSETVASWPMVARYAWVLLWGYLDDHGRGIDNARIIATDCFPLDDDIAPTLMSEWLSIYENSRSICRYEFEGKRYLHALNWSSYQKPQHPSKVRIPPCEEHELGALKKWINEREKERMKVSGNPHEGFVKASPTSRGGGEVSKEVSEGVEGGPSSGHSTPPLFPAHCPAHADVAMPGNCGNCKDVRKAYEARGPRLSIVASVPAKVPHCGECDETRHRNTDFGVIRCPECHPLAEEASA